MQHLPDYLLTYNLHILVCRLHKQEEAKGCVARRSEMWVERGIQFVKSNVKYRTTACPEKLYVHDVMRDEALLAMRHDDYTTASVSTAVKMLDEVVPQYRVNVRAGHFYDTGDDLTGTQLIGLGKRLRGGAMHQGLQYVNQHLRGMGHTQWAESCAQVSVELCSYTIAHKRGDELMTSVAHKRSKSR